MNYRKLRLCVTSRLPRATRRSMLIITARAIIPSFRYSHFEDSLNPGIVLGNSSDLKPMKLIFKEHDRISIVTRTRETGSFAWARPTVLGFVLNRGTYIGSVASLVFLLTANKDEDAEQQRGAERPTGHPGVERYVDSASS